MFPRGAQFLKSCLSAILLFSISTVVAQNHAVDSLQREIDKTKDPRALLSLYLQQCRAADELSESRPLRKASSNLLEVAKKLNDADGECYARYYQICADYYSNKMEQLVESLDLVLADAERRKLNPILLGGFSLKGSVLQKRGEVDEAIRCFEKSLTYPDQPAGMLAFTWSSLARAYENKGDYYKALECMNKTYDFVKSKNDPTSELMFNQNMGLVYLKIKQPAKARTYFEKNLAYLRKIKHKRNQAISLTNIGHTYYEEENFEKALEYYQRALDLDKANGITSSRQERLMNVANARKQLDGAAKAQPMLDTARVLAKKEQDPATLLSINNSLANLYLEEKNYAKALPILLESKQLCKSLRRRENLLSVYQGLAVAYEKTGQHELAYEAHRNVYAIRDSLYNENGLRQFQELQTRYETTKKEQEISVLEKTNQIRELEYRQLLIDKQAQAQAAQLRDLRQKDQIKQLKITELTQANENIRKAREIENLGRENQQKDLQLEKQTLTLRNKDLEVQHRNFIITAILLLIVIGAAVTYLLYSRSRLQLKNKAMVLEQRLLRSQLNPHFIFNSLASIQNFLFENNTEKTARYLSKFSKLMRQTLEHSREDSILLSQEIELLDNYLQLQALRFVNKFKWTITVTSDINPDETYIPPMFAQPFIENSLEHGILHTSDQGIIDIHFSLHNGLLRLSVTDNGGGIVQAQQQRAAHKKEYKSLATQITLERLGLLRAKYKQSFDLVMNELTNDHNKVVGTQVSITLPYHSQ